MKIRKPSKNELMSNMRSLLNEEALSTQEDLSDALKSRGFEVNQAMISRTLNQLKAIKMREGDHMVYRLPIESPPISAKDILSQQILNISANEALVVILTTPGSANLVARVIDQNKTSLETLGTLAGDDTIFVAPISIRKTQLLLKNIKALLL